ncbi:hypothetical protein WICPIJ_005274 [Wickerhamomyces pijperi]|uniref:Uncharacterized protein n=1 Tax=Wickerhamomyces pijperi TaxID=599730 RepID=A0A9P8Q6A3_WICPI|nr:hypothetical protein WICPIJ_005274 [Wickerhamomyces pijperi]
MSTQTFLDETRSTRLGEQWNSLEEGDIFLVEEHVTDGDDILVDLDWVTCDDGSLSKDSLMFSVKEGTGTN